MHLAKIEESLGSEYQLCIFKWLVRGADVILVICRHVPVIPTPVLPSLLLM